MKQFKLLILLLVIGFVGEAQINYLPIKSRYKLIAGLFDSTLHIPSGTTPSLRTGGYSGSGAIFYKTSDSTVYVYTGTQWVSVKGSGGGGSADSTVFATLYRLDTAKVAIRLSIAGKLNISDTAALVAGYTRLQRFTDSLAAHTARFDGVTSSLATKLNISDTANMRPRLYAGSNVTITGTYPNLTIASTGSGSSDTSTFIVDTTKKRLAEVIGTDTVRLKSIEVEIAGEPAIYVETDSTLKVTIPQFDSEIKGVVPASTGTTTDFLRADGTWAEPAGGGGSTDTIPYSHNPSDWLVSLPHRTVPYFYTSGLVGDPTGSYYESSMYTPTPVHITNGTNKGKIFVVTKGDFSRKLFGWISSDRGFSWDTTGVVLAKSTSGFDKSGVSMAHMIYDSLTNVIHMWYMGYSDSLYPSVFGVGYATASGDAPSTFTKQGQVLSGENFRVQMGMPHKTGYLKVSSVVKGRETGKYYFHGSYWLGNGTTWTDSTIRLWQGVSATINGNIDSSQQILAPIGTHTLLENPTVWYGDDGNYWMIHTNGYTDLNGGIDSVQYLQTAKSPSLKNPSWTVQPGIVLYPTKDSTWMGKRVYNAQLLKNTSDYYDRPISLLHDSLGRGVSNMYETQWMLFYSASYPNSYHDQSSIIRLTPQRPDLYTASVGFNGNIPNIVQKNGSIQVNIPFSDTTKRWSGGITWDQLRDLYRSVKTGTMGQLAYYDSSLRRVRGLPTFSVSVGSYPTFTFGAAGYNAAIVYFRNGVGTTGMISEDGGMNYYGSSTYMSHIWRDKISGGIVLGKMWSSSGSPFAYFPGKTVFGSTVQATSHLQTDKTFAGIMSAAKTSAYTIADDYSIPCNATSAAFTVTLPQAIGCPGRIYIIKKIDASGNAVTVQGSGSEPIDASNTYALASQWKYVVVQSTGSATTGWYIIGGN